MSSDARPPTLQGRDRSDGSDPDGMPYYPIFLDLTQQPCLVIGGGAVSTDKTRGLLKAGAKVTVISPDLAPALRDLHAAGRIRHIHRRYRPGDMEGYAIVMVATGDRAANAALRAEGRERRVLVNCADDPDNCDFIVPSVVRRGLITIGISTGGGSPALARRMREELTDYFTEDFEPLAEMLAETRQDLKRRALLASISQESWQHAIDGRLRALLAQRRWGQAKALLLARLGVPLVPADPAGATPARPPISAKQGA